MRFDYDVIVVGAGNGGLTAASRASGAGLKTVLLEKHNLPGGFAASFVRGSFEFEASLHELCDVGTEDEPRVIRRLFSDLGSDVKFYNEKQLFRTIVTGEDGYDVTLEAGVDIGEKSSTLPATVVLESPSRGRITVCEGKFHQIKRMFAAVSNKITYLERVSFGGVKLDASLGRGEWRYLTEDEIASLEKRN